MDRHEAGTAEVHSELLHTAPAAAEGATAWSAARAARALSQT